MAQPTLELECPSCGANLELDRGFAGGVCRCFDCGTLMTVPADPAHHAPEQLVRPDSPGAPSRPESPTAVEHPDAPGAAATLPDDQTYTTASGQVVHVSADAVPTARRRRTGVRITTAVVFSLFVLLIIGACVGAVLVLMAGPPKPDAAEIAIEQFGYDSSVNPYTLETPNVVGLPIEVSTAVIVDASGSSRGWLSLIQDQLNLGLTRPGKAASVRLVYALDPVPEVFAARDASQPDEEGLKNFQDQFRARGVAPIDAAIALAVEGSPRRIVLVTGRAFYGADADAVTAPLFAADIPIDVIDIGGDNEALRDVADATGGRYVALAERDLQDWYREQ